MKASGQMKNRMYGYRLVVLISLVLSLLSMSLMAEGAAERDKPFGLALTDEFMTVLEQVNSGEIDVPSAMETLRSLRQDFGRYDNDDYRAMEQILTAVQTKVMTREQAREEFCRLDESCVGLSGEQIRIREQKMSQLHEEKRSENSPESNDPPSRGTGSDKSRQEDGSGKR